MSFADLKASRTSRHKAHGAAGVAKADDENVDASGLSAQHPEKGGIVEHKQQRDDNAEAGPSSSRHAESTLESASILMEDETSALGLQQFNLEVRRTKDRGRGLYSTKQYKPGDRIYLCKERSVASALSPNHIHDFCSYCYLNSRDSALLNGREEKNMLRCGGCKVVHYCSKICQSSDWPFHSPECKTLIALRTKPAEFGDTWVPLEYFRALGRFVWARRKWLDTNSGKGEYPFWEEYMIMQPHTDTSPRKSSEIAHVSAQLKSYLQTIPSLDPHLSDTELQSVVGRLQTNAFTLSAPDLTPIGVWISPPAAMSNHSCYPNAVIEFPLGGGRGLEIIAIADISPGDEIFTSYTDVSYPRTSRQVELFETYKFHCACSLCFTTSPERTPVSADPRWCLIHPKCKRKGKLPMPEFIQPQSLQALKSAVDEKLGWEGIARGRCDGCDEEVVLEVKDLPGLIMKGKKYLDMDDRGELIPHFGHPESAIIATQNILSSLEDYMPSCSFPSLPLLRLLFRLHLPPTLSTLQSALSAIQKATQSAVSVYPPHYPALAVLAAERASILNEYTLGITHLRFSSKEVSQGVQEAYEAAKEAVVACEKGFGKASGGGLVGIAMRGIAEQRELQLRTWKRD